MAENQKKDPAGIERLRELVKHFEWKVKELEREKIAIDAKSEATVNYLTLVRSWIEFHDKGGTS